MSTAQGYLKRIEHSDDQPVECGNGRLLIGRMRAKVGNEQREDDLYSVTLRNGGNMIAWGTAKKACELAQYLDQEDTVITLRFPTLSLGKKLQDAIAQTAEDYLSQKADPEALRGPKRVKHEHLDGLYKHDPPNDDSNSNPGPVPGEPLGGDAAQEATKQLEDQQQAQSDAPQKNEQPGEQRTVQDNAAQEAVKQPEEKRYTQDTQSVSLHDASARKKPIEQHKVDQPAHHATSAGEDTVPRSLDQNTPSNAPPSPPPPGVTQEAWEAVQRFYQAGLNSEEPWEF